jgi:hypothetical protein
MYSGIIWRIWRWCRTIR